MTATADDRALASRALETLIRRGFAKAQVRLTSTERHELNANTGRISLLRTNHDLQLGLLGIIDDKRSTMAINKLDGDAVAAAADDLWDMAQGSAADAANDISPAQPPQRFSTGPEQVDFDAMAQRFDEYLDYARSTHPTLTVREGHIDFNEQRSLLLNSNGVDFDSRTARYGAQVMFSSRQGTDQSSFNYTGLALAGLDRPLHTLATLATLMRQSTEQVRTRKTPGPFTGDLVITPDCIGDFLGFLLESVSNVPMIGGTSPYRGRLGERVVSPALTVHSRPRDLPAGYFVTADGFEAHNATVIERGVLRSYLLDLYAANKTGLPRAVTGGGCIVVEPGEAPLEALIGGVDRGILISRFSGGRPNDRGDFSGIAKNSYYIEGGEVRYPLSETMISGNLDALLNAVVGVSRERADFGSHVAPWLRVSGVGVS
ncbi:MAG: TldD/PmbA family protein [Pseudomonadales bacterium]